MDLNVGVYYGFLIWHGFDRKKLVNLLAKGGHYLEQWLDYHGEEEMEAKEADENWVLVSDMYTCGNWYMLVYEPLTQKDSFKTGGAGGFGMPVDQEEMVVPEEVKAEAEHLKLSLMGNSEEERRQCESDIKGPQFFAYAFFS